MTLKIKNTLTGKKDEFKPLKAGHVSMYVCGPTVYDVAHLGHGRSAVCFDVIRKYLMYSDYDVKFVSNYTDIDDKMINRAREEGVTVPELAERIIPEYDEDYSSLGVLAADEAPMATSYIDEMVEFVGRMEKAGVTYVIEGDGVYFDVSKSATYGKLSGQKLEDLKVGARVAENEAKKNPYDFVVWKFAKEGEPHWPSPWGDGRPGWHLECSAMSWKLLGEKFDIHGGGGDLTFPHHECEIAQSESVFGEGSFAQYWMHNGFITVDKEKMSKSLGNFATLKDILSKYSGFVVRLMFLQTHYANPIEFSEDLLEQAKAGLARIHDFVRNLKVSTGESMDFDLEPFVEKFEKSMDNDFDTSGGLAALFDLIKYVGFDTDYKKEPILKALEAMDQVFGVIFVEENGLDSEIESLIKDREDARGEKDFGKADQIRNDLLKKGIELEDTSNGTVWKRL
jgi:cysteinyl-tRNA synthetase